MIAAFAVTLFAIAYAVVLFAGLASLSAPSAPIEDPWFTLLEILIVAMMPAIVMLIMALRASSPKGSELLGRWAVTFIIVTAVLTTIVHTALFVLRRAGVIDENLRPVLLSFDWPSVPYILDIIAWDLFFGLAMLCAAPLADGTRFASAIRVTMTISGLLALAGLAGPIAGDMRLRAIGILGYAGVFPITATLMALHFRQRIKTSIP
ncbi:hypothetical protein [Hephaestia caeni]|uniref:hypothetical protein n=1 Tax=Hephaestia caeni TaxID=645617 RepID=UPI0011C400DF|nr:hypothetical protein [Hephaestia caeni]